MAPDSHAEVAGAICSVPFRHRGERLDVRLTRIRVGFFRGDLLVKTHSRRARGRQTDLGDLPADRTAFYERTPHWCLRQAKERGPSVFEAVRQLLSANTLTNLRQAQGVLRLADSYDPPRLDATCRRALGFGDPRYRTVKNILRARSGRAGRSRGPRREPARACPPPGERGLPPLRQHPKRVMPMMTHQLERNLKILRLGGMLDTLELRLKETQRDKAGYLEFLETLLEDEINRRGQKALTRRLPQDPRPGDPGPGYLGLSGASRVAHSLRSGGRRQATSPRPWVTWLARRATGSATSRPTGSSPTEPGSSACGATSGTTSSSSTTSASGASGRSNPRTFTELVRPLRQPRPGRVRAGPPGQQLSPRPDGRQELPFGDPAGLR